MKEVIKRLLAGFGYSMKPAYTKYFFGNRTIVERIIYGRKVLMPKDHTISYNLSHFPYYNSNLQRLVKQYQQFRKEKFSVIDVGANIGDTLMMLRQVTDLPVHCFEGDAYYFGLLQKNSAGIPGCFLHEVLLSEKPEIARVKHKTAFGTTEFVSARNDGESLSFDSIDSFFANNFPEERIGVVKTDTDGYDIKILRGAAAILTKYQPVVFLEYDRILFEKNNDNGIVFFNFMRQIGYDGVLVYDNFGKLICVTRLTQIKTVTALHCYLKNNTHTLSFYDLALCSKMDDDFFDLFSDNEIAFFEE